MERDCLRCGSRMVKGYKLKLNFKVYDTVITKTSGGIFNTIGKPSLSICPSCGEISMHLDDVESIQEE